MPPVHELSRAEARRIAVRAQLLSKERPNDVMEVVRHLTVVQPDPTKAVAPSADLVLWSRLGSSYDPAELRDAVDQQRLIEHQGYLRPSEDVALFRAEMAHWPGTGPLKDWQVGNARWVEANDACRLDILERLRGDGPLPTSELPDTCQVPWESSGWNNDRNVVMLLKLMTARGEVAACRTAGSGAALGPRRADLPRRPRSRRGGGPPGAGRAAAAGARHRPGEGRHTTGRAARRGRDRRRGRGRGRQGAVAGRAVAARGVLGGAFAGRAALLSPFDRLVQDRKRMTEIFEFEYFLEMYKPVAKRRWGYYALPILYADRLVGKLDATADHAEGVLRVDAVHEDEPFDAETTRRRRRRDRGPRPLARASTCTGWPDVEPRILLDEERRLTRRRLASLDEDYDGVVAASRDTNADDEHDPEGATIAFERSQVGALAAQAREHLAEVDAALARLEAGGYGVCEGCGEPIAEERLEARPIARTCITCASAR